MIILEESLGAQFIGTLGGKPLSPHFDELAKQGWLFENLYATGTRSVRGIEAVTAGFTPTPARSVVKLAGAQNGFLPLHLCSDNKVITLPLFMVGKTF